MNCVKFLFKKSCCWKKKRHIYDKKNKKCMDKRRKFQQQKLHFCIEFKLFNFLQIMIMIKGVN